MCLLTEEGQQWPGAGAMQGTYLRVMGYNIAIITFILLFDIIIFICELYHYLFLFCCIGIVTMLQ